MAKPNPPAASMRDSMDVTTVDLDTLHEDPANARLHNERNLQAIAASLKQFGQVEPLVVHKNTGKVIGGNGRLQAMRGLGWTRVDINQVDIDDTQATALGLALNRTAELAEWDQEALVQLSKSLEGTDVDLGAMSLDAESLLAELIKSDDSPDPVEGGGAASHCDEDIPEPPTIAKTKKGDIYFLGEHRLMCADSSDADALAHLFDGHKADMIFTDPPYNYAERKQGSAASIRESRKALMDSEWDKGFDFSNYTDTMLSFLADDASCYVCTSHFVASGVWAWMDTWAKFWGFCIWTKTNPMPSMHKRHYTWSAELICYATRGKHTFNFPEAGHASNVWSMSSVSKNDLHPTMKPIGIPSTAIIRSSKKGDIIADFFSGAGSTLLACEELGRIAYCCEIDPGYCDVIVTRWETLTGKKAILQSGAAV